MQEHERLVNELRNAGLRQKGRMASLQQEVADSKARLAATNPRQAERLLSEVGQLRETIGTLSAYKVQPLDSKPETTHACLMIVLKLLTSSNSQIVHSDAYQSTSQLSLFGQRYPALPTKFLSISSGGWTGQAVNPRNMRRSKL